MKNVYVVIYDDAYEYDTKVYVKVFKELDGAREYMKKLLPSKEDLTYMEVIEEDEDTFLAYEEGYWAKNHIFIHIEKKEMN